MFAEDQAKQEAERQREELKHMEETVKKNKQQPNKMTDKAFPSLPKAPPKTAVVMQEKRKPIFELLEETTEESKAPAYDPFAGKK